MAYSGFVRLNCSLISPIKPNETSTEVRKRSWISATLSRFLKEVDGIAGERAIERRYQRQFLLSTPIILTLQQATIAARTTGLSVPVVEHI